MKCYLCGSERYREILNKSDTLIWTNASDEVTSRKRMYRCVINQCENCGHIYQPLSSDLKSILGELYCSNHAQLSTPLGRGNWGMKRAEKFLDILQKNVDLKKHDSAIEIGCADGYLLRCLKKNGFQSLVGIEPSIDKTEKIDGVSFLKDFAGEQLQFPQRYGLIFSSGVFEHIEEIGGVMKFCKNNLRKNGELFFCIPNVKRQLRDGDPAFFSHQHVHYYTENSLTYLLSKHGFEIKSLFSTGESLVVCTKIDSEKEVSLDYFVFYDDYQKRLSKVLSRIENILRGDNVIVHGVNNALNNILSWLNTDYRFTLVDNDNTKHGKKYFGKVVNCLDNIILSSYKTVLIIPTSFSETIKADYIDRGFKGIIKSLTQGGASISCDAAM